MLPIDIGSRVFWLRSTIDFGIERIKLTLPRLSNLAQGGTAVGTGLNTKRGLMLKLLKKYPI